MPLVRQVIIIISAISKHTNLRNMLAEAQVLFAQVTNKLVKHLLPELNDVAPTISALRHAAGSSIGETSCCSMCNR